MMLPDPPWSSVIQSLISLLNQHLRHSFIPRMRRLHFLGALAFVPSVLSASVASPPGDGLASCDGDRGHYTVPGLGSRKRAVLKAGGNTLDLAIAMLET
jgi:hypothetical protein